MSVHMPREEIIKYGLVKIVQTLYMSIHLIILHMN